MLKYVNKEVVNESRLFIWPQVIVSLLLPVFVCVVQVTNLISIF